MDNMIIIQDSGRLGNAMFRNCAASILSKKFDIKVKNYVQADKLTLLCPKFYTEGTKIYKNRIEVKKNKDFFNILRKDNIDYGLKLKNFCQHRYFILKYKNEILNQFDLQYNLKHKDDLFIHVRLGDLIGFHGRITSVDYYIKAIELIKFNRGYISSDTPSHEIVTYLMNRFNLTLYENEPAETINFAKDFGNLILSKGTFSWWIAFLSKAKNVFYPNDGRWCHHLFVFDNWIPINYTNNVE